MNYEFHPEALDEFEAAARYYAGSQPGLGQRFITCVESALEQVSESPTRWRVFEQDVRHFLVQHFPYVVLYSVEPDYVLIIAVMHCHREPGYWRHRTTGNT